MTDIIHLEDIQSRIFKIRGQAVMLDRDLARPAPGQGAGFVRSPLGPYNVSLRSRFPLDHDKEAPVNIPASIKDWLLEPENPSVRYFTLVDLLDRPAGDRGEELHERFEVVDAAAVPVHHFVHQQVERAPRLV